ncbi:hypothetical protein HALLA_18780 [Halostagnicola larsenii XH-48]|uniref:Uncharacterized protein n=1 Tax=Halostagnicola larsenii XH-48 TaxID=797299 RepID=W0JRD3_9EURY|nr:hypothetical protein [Halostagnicola larsenii]AHG01174.1 hypothetical protein HALLA_18780 [Halostagnicola larsenii XH-48]
MRRRELIAALGVTLPTAGCLSANEADVPITNATDKSDTEAFDGTFSVGDTTDTVGPHELTVENESERSRTISLRITDTKTDETLLERSYSIGGGGSINGELRGPAEYRVAVTSSETGTEHVRKIEYFDTCNDYWTTVTISSDGTITGKSIQTQVACDV